MSEVLVGGVEGGATNTHCVIMNSKGEIIGRVKGVGSNPCLLGMVEARKRILELVEKAKENAGISKGTPLSGLGLSLSGCEQEEANNEFLRGLKQIGPNLSEKYYITSDTDGSIAATSDKGGVTCIAGTGSNTVLINPDGQKYQCGGWGYLLGDEGSAYKISLAAIKYCFNELDNVEDAPYPIEKVWNLIKQHFNAKVQADLIPPFYSNFDKAYISSLCKNLAVLAGDGDKLAALLFDEAGRDLAHSIWAVAQKASPKLMEVDGGLHVLGVGSVWLSWNLLQEGFVKFIVEKTTLKRMSLIKLTVEHGVGAAYLASVKLNLSLKRDYMHNYDVFYEFDRIESKVNKNGCSSFK